jgi:hypothetical protein
VSNRIALPMGSRHAPAAGHRIEGGGGIRAPDDDEEG